MGMPLKEGILLFRPQPSPSRMRGLIRIDPDQHSDLVEAQTGIVASANGGIVQRSFNALIGVRRNYDLSPHEEPAMVAPRWRLGHEPTPREDDSRFKRQ